jgi:hypothetical protein
VYGNGPEAPDRAAVDAAQISAYEKAHPKGTSAESKVAKSPAAADSSKAPAASPKPQKHQEEVKEISVGPTGELTKGQFFWDEEETWKQMKAAFRRD